MSTNLYVHKVHKIETERLSQINELSTLGILFNLIVVKTNKNPLQEGGMIDCDGDIIEIPRKVVQFMHDNVSKLNSSDLEEVKANEGDHTISWADMADMLHSILEDSDKDNNFIILSKF